MSGRQLYQLLREPTLEEHAMLLDLLAGSDAVLVDVVPNRAEAKKALRTWLMHYIYRAAITSGNVYERILDVGLDTILAAALGLEDDDERR